MDSRFIVSKTFSSGVTTQTSLKNGSPMISNIISHYHNIDDTEYDVKLEENFSELKKTSPIQENLVWGMDKNLCAVTRISATESRPLCQAFDYKDSNGHSYADMIESNQMSLRRLAYDTFNAIDSRTGKPDLLEGRDDAFAHYVPIMVANNIIPLQKEKDTEFFNPEGTVSIAEFLDSLTTIKYGADYTEGAKKSLDSVVNENDYFNVGYNDCLLGISSPFYRLYTRQELIKPITRIELAYITVICWRDFINKYEQIYNGTYALGVNFDWNKPSRYLRKFTDGFNYKVVKKVTADEIKAVSLDIDDYKKNALGEQLSMSEFKNSMLKGIKGIPMPMFMSLLELDVLKLFNFENNELSPLKEVSRGEWAYFLAKLAEEFSTKYTD